MPVIMAGRDKHKVISVNKIVGGYAFSNFFGRLVFQQYGAGKSFYLFCFAFCNVCKIVGNKFQVVHQIISDIFHLTNYSL